MLFEEYRSFFSITNDRTSPASEIVFQANDHCHQENLIVQLKGGVKAMSMLVVRPGEQLGVPGDGEPGQEPEDLGGVAAARGRSVGGEALCGEAVAVADGVQHVLRGDHPGAVPDLEDVPADRVPIAVLESLEGSVPPDGGAPTRSAAVLNPRRPEAGVRMLRSLEATNRREAVR